MHIKFISRAFEQYLFTWVDLLWGFAMGICTREICIRGSPYAKLPEKAFFSVFAMVINIPRTLRMASPPPSYPPFAIIKG